MAKRATKFDVFISHAALDLPLANELSSACRASGLEVHVDGGNPTDARMANSLRKALSESQALLIVMPVTGLTTWMLIELGAAKALSKPIYAITQDLSSSRASWVPADVRLYTPGQIGDVIGEIKSLRKSSKKRVSSR
jgi:hypothetical protein